MYIDRHDAREGRVVRRYPNGNLLILDSRTETSRPVSYKVVDGSGWDVGTEVLFTLDENDRVTSVGLAVQIAAAAAAAV